MWLGQPAVQMSTMREQSWERVKAGRIPETSVWSPVLSHPRFPSRVLGGGGAEKQLENVKCTCVLLPVFSAVLLRWLDKDRKQSFQRLWEDCCFSELITSLERGRRKWIAPEPCAIYDID